jgi:hypothetical protein
MRPTLAALLLAALLPAPGGATEPGAPIPGLTDIPVAEWTAMAAGRTLTYTIGGAFWARERYHEGNRVTLQFYDGACLEGTWDYDPPLYCFHWVGEGSSCFRHARLGDQILVLETRDGLETGALQVMTGASDAPLDCGPQAIS